MTSESGEPQAIVDDRLAEVRDSVIADGETVIAQEEGDQGQGIVLTNSRVLVMKVGITSTGVFNGNIIGDFPLSEITAVNVRKGPLGAVIQICAGEKKASSEQGPPDNVIIFTGAARVKKCEAIAAKIEKALGKPVSEQVEAKSPRGGREPRTLTEEMYSEPQQQAITPVIVNEPEKIAPVPVAAIPANTFGPNPNLPKPGNGDCAGAKKALVLAGLFAAALFVGISVTAPLKTVCKTPSIDIDVKHLTNNPEVAKQQIKIISDFETKSANILNELDDFTVRLESALRSSNKAAVTSALNGNIAEKTWREMSAVQAPPGLTGARSTIVSGLFTIKGAVADVSTCLQSSSPINSQSFIASIENGTAQVRNGQDAIKHMRMQLTAQLAESKQTSQTSKPKPH